MPIRIPQIVSQQQLQAQPGPMLDPSSAGSLVGAPARAFGQAADAISGAFADYNKAQQKAQADFNKVQKALTEQDMKLDEQSKITDLKDLLDQESVALNEEGVEPDQREPLFRQRATQRVQELAGQLKYSASRATFEAKAKELLALEGIKQRHEGVKVKHARIGVTAGVLNQEDVNTAVFGEEPAERDKAMKEIGKRIGELVTTGIWGQEKATGEMEQLLAQVEMGRARVAAQNPEKRAEVIEQLLNGGLRRTKVGAQLDLADSLMRQEEAAQNKRDLKMAKEAEADRQAQVDELEDRADRGELTDAELRIARTDRVAAGPDFRRLSDKVRAAGTFGGRTNDEVYNRFALDLAANAYSVSAGEIRRAQEAGNLAATGPRSASTLLDMIPADAKDPTGRAAADKDITQQPLFKEGLHVVRELRGGKGPLESLTGEASARLDRAEREYHDLARSGKFDMTQLPEVARKIVDRVRAESPLTMGDPEPLLRLRYQTPKDLLAAQAAGLIPPAEFNRQFRLMQQLGIMKGPGKDTPRMPQQPQPPAKKTPDARR